MNNKNARLKKNIIRLIKKRKLLLNELATIDKKKEKLKLIIKDYGKN